MAKSKKKADPAIQREKVRAAKLRAAEAAAARERKRSEDAFAKARKALAKKDAADQRLAGAKGKAFERASLAADRAIYALEQRRVEALAQSEKAREAARLLKQAKQAIARAGKPRPQYPLSQKQPEWAKKTQAAMKKRIGEKGFTKEKAEDAFLKWKAQEKINREERARKAKENAPPKLRAGKGNNGGKGKKYKLTFQGLQVLRGQSGGPSVMAAVYSPPSTSAMQLLNAIARHPVIQSGGKPRYLWIENQKGEEIKMDPAILVNREDFRRAVQDLSAAKGWDVVRTMVEV